MTILQKGSRQNNLPQAHSVCRPPPSLPPPILPWYDYWIIRGRHTDVPATIDALTSPVTRFLWRRYR
jgi:hypothetical protein